MQESQQNAAAANASLSKTLKNNSANASAANVSIKYQKVAEKDVAGEADDFELVPPDGGWAWLVLIGATLVNILVPGTIKSFGVLFVEFIEVFEASPSTAAWIPALCYFLYSFLGPLSGVLCVVWGYRTVTLIGGTFAALGMILSFFATSVQYLYFSYGFMVGTGAGLSFPPTVYIIMSYFLKRRGLANGICISGSAFGSIILPPLLRFLLETYGYRGAVLLMGGITLNVWVASLFFDPVEKHMKKVPKSSGVNQEEQEGLLKKATFMIHSEESILPELHDEGDTFPENIEMTNGFGRSASSAAFQRSASSAAFQGFKNRERKISVPTSRGEFSRARIGTVGSRNQLAGSTTLHSVPESANAVELQSQSRLSTVGRAPRPSPSTSSFQYITTPYHGSTLTLQPEVFASTFSLTLRSFIKGDKEAQLSEDEPKRKWSDVTFLKVLKNPLYLVILISNSTNAISYTNFIILLPAYALTLGYDKNMGALLLSVVSTFDLVGRIGGSALSDYTPFRKEYYFVGGMLLSGISLACLPFAPTYRILCACCATFGLASGTYVGITAVIMADTLGAETWQSSYGISLFVNGCLQLIGPPINGFIFSKVQTYVPIFFWLGIILVIGASIWIVIPFIKQPKNMNDSQDELS